jgi:hypothetical protein
VPEVPIGFPRAYAEFPDPADADQVLRCDLTWLTSRWSCIFGQGCPGIYADRPDDGCCTLGAHFADADDERRVGQAVHQLTAAQWQYKPAARRAGWAEFEDPAQVTPGDPPDRKTRIGDGACIFLNRPGFAGGAGCALHRAALDAGESPLDWKPDVCWQLPLRRIDTVDESGQVVSTLREWKRRDWGAGGADFHWWCTEAPDAFVGHGPVYEAMRDEIVEMTSAWAYERFVDHVTAGGRDRARVSERFLPHPALRRRRGTS